jgi:2',3'-cyclic-nucleotide 2'-phosphodiesterase (5'-nucleotidase family)
MFNKIRTIGKIAKTVASPITHAKNVISSTFKKSPTRKEQITKYKKKALKMTKDATARVSKEMKSKEKVIGEKAAKEIGNTTKSKMMKDYLRYNRDLKAKGGRIGLKKGGGFPDHSGDGKITQKDILMAKGVIPKTKNKNKKKVI